jgi:hypothetical protein
LRNSLHGKHQRRRRHPRSGFQAHAIARASPRQLAQLVVGAWDKFELRADEFVEQGDTVVMLGHTDYPRCAGGRLRFVPVGCYCGTAHTSTSTHVPPE